VEEEKKCPTCHVVVRPTDYFCYNCGANLKPKPPSTSASAQIALYIKSILLPPMGIVWAFTYLRQKDAKSKIVGFMAIIITVVVLVAVVLLTVQFINRLSSLLNEQLGSYGYY
jgi:hypothetical protein